MLISVYLFFLCVSAGFWYFGVELQRAGVFTEGNNPAIDRSLNFTTLNNNFNSTAEGYEGGAGFNPAFIFGDFGKAITEFMNVVTGGYAVQMLGKLGFPESMQTIVQTIVVGFGSIGALIYLISGRG
jgi:hypothetical protein